MTAQERVRQTLRGLNTPLTPPENLRAMFAYARDHQPGEPLQPAATPTKENSSL